MTPTRPTFRRIAQSLLTAPIRRTRPVERLERLEDRCNPAPLAAVTGLPGDTQPLLGEAVSYSLNFANAGPDTGYAPFIELAVDSSGPDNTTSGGTPDGIGTPVVTAAGLSLTPRGSVTLVAGQTTFTNPITNESRTIASVYGSRFNTGDTIYFYALPFGSFTPAQNTTINVTLPTSNRADVGSPLPVSVVGGFRDDAPSLAGPAFYAARADGGITPQLYRLVKTYVGPESETATGPNYVRSYVLTVDVATGQTVSDLRVTDTLAASMSLVSRTAADFTATLGGAGAFVPANLTATGGAAASPTGPGGTFSYNFLPTGSYVGVDGPDAVLRFNFYVPRDAAGGAATVAQGTDSTLATNTTTSSLDWDTIEPRDPNGNDLPPATSGSVLTHTLEQHAVAIQKTAQVVTLGGVAVAPGQPIQPGQALIRYTLDFQVSDYHAVDSVFVRDVIGDGQKLYLGPVGAGSAFPTLQVNNAFVYGLAGAPGTRASTTGDFGAAGVIDYQRRFTSRVPSDPTTIPADGPASGVFNNLAPSVQAPSPTSDAGTTYLGFDVSAELRARLGAQAGRLVGAEIANDGTGPFNAQRPGSPTLPGAVTGRIVFYVEVTEEFSDEFLLANGGSGDPTVDQGDVLGNTVNDPRTPLRDGVEADELAAATINAAVPTVIGQASDDSGSAVSIPYGVQTKRLAAINGQGVPSQGFSATPFSVQAGDQVTYLLTYSLPISRFENLRLTDFPPLPVMNLTQTPNDTPTFTRNPANYGFNPGEVGVFVNGVTPGITDAAYVSDTYFNTFAPGNGSVRNPGLSIDGPNNGLTLDFGTQDDLADRSTVISVLVTFAVGNDPFAADLFLTNQLRVAEGSTNAGTTTVEDLQRFELVRPTVNLYKGIVGVVAGGALPTSTTFGDVVFTGPGTTFGFSNQLNTTAEAIALGNANTAALDAGDSVRFALVAQNVGKGDAFDTRIRDVLPTGYVIPAAFPGSVFRGASGGVALVAGTDYTVTYNNVTGEFVIDLIDNYTAGNLGGPAEDARSGGLSRGADGPAAITNGSNAVVVLFDLTLAGTVAPGQSLTNTATVPIYSNSNNGPNYTDPLVIPGALVPTDTATVTVPTAGTKSIVSTTEASTSEAGTGTTGSPRLATIGEVVRYRLAFQIAEGTATNFQLRDNLPAGLTFLNDGTARVALVSNNGITSSTLSGAGLAVVGSAAVTPTFTIPGAAITGGPFTTGVDPLFSLGTLTNDDSDTDAEFVVVEFNALVDNSVAGSNDLGDNLDNTFAALVNGTTVFTSALVRVRVVEPSITNVAKGANPASGDAGDTVTFTVTFSNAAGANNTTAFDLFLTDILPAVGYDNVAFVVGSLLAPTAVSPLVTVTGNTVTFTADSLPTGGSVSFQYTARLVAGVGPGFYRNVADLTYTSLPGANGSGAPGAPGTDTGERTGSGVGPNDYLDSDFEDVFVNVPVLKEIVSTNQLFTAGNTVAVGEQVVYRVTVTVPEGTTPGAVLRDALPAGLAVVSLDSLSVVADVGLTTNATGGFPGVLTAARAALAAPGQGFSFNLGDLINADRDAGGETLTFTYTVVVLNTLGNQRGTALTNAATFASGGLDRTTTSAPPVTVAEPTVRVTKTVTPTTGDASNSDADAVTFTLVIDHAPLSNADAFNVALTDALPAGFTYVTGSLTNTAGVAPAALGESAGTITATYTSLTTTQSSTLTFRARLNATTTPGQTVTNTASLTYTSLPGDVTAAQSAFNAASVERTGAGAPLNDYTASDPEGVTVNSNSIAGNIYRDLDNDGLYEPGAGETLITGSIRLRLTGTDNLGFAVDTTLTTATGAYTFTGLRPGSYVVTQLDQPAGLLDGRDTPGTLFGGTGTPAVTPRAPRDADAITSVVIGLGGSKAGVSYNFGELLPAQLGDFVWHDLNGNGLQDGGEPGLNGVAVSLTGTDDSGQPVTLNTTTTAPGFYQFTNLRPSDGTGYVVTFGTLPGFVRTVRDATTAPGFTDALDSDGDAATGATAGVVVLPGASVQTVDQGLYQPVSIGDRVYFDRDADGVQDAGEPGIPGAAIEVVWLGPNGVIGGGDDLLFNATTGVNGGWLVANLPPGSFRVTATPPAGQGWALTDSLDNAALSATNPVVVTVASGGNLATVDFGYRGTGSIGNRLYLDADGDGIQDANGLEPGLPGVTVTLRSDANADGDFTDADDGLFTTVTDAAGFYSFAFLPPGAYQVSVAGAAGLPANVVLTDSLDDGALTPSATVLKVLGLGENEATYDFGFQGNASLGDRVYYDADGDGVQDANEPGVPGVGVTATWFGPNGAAGGGDDVTFTTTTDAAGLYLFPGLPANPLAGAAPNYRVTVATPANFPVFTDSLDNGALAAVRPVDIQVSPTDGSALNDRRDVDFGFRGTASLGDTVFLDSNGNGRQDGGAEVGIPGVGVSLFFDRNADGDFADAGEDVALATTTTGAGGIYVFTDLAAGNYQVVFGTTAAGVTYTRTVADSAVATDATDSDANQLTGRTGTYTLANGASNVTVDAGLYVPVSIGDRVFFDRDGDGNQDAGEPGIPGAAIEVVWLGPDGVIGGGDDQTFNVTTGVDGGWLVINLPPGSFRVTATPPAGQGWALTDSLDNAVLSATNPVVVTVASGGNLATVDFGYRGTGSIGNRLYLDADGDGVQDANGLEPGLPGVTVTLRYDANADGDFTDPDDGLFTTVTDGAGAYTFAFLPPGGYQVSVAGAAGLPANVVLTDSLDDGALTPSATVLKVLGLGENEATYDFGFQGNASLGDRVYYDADGDGVQDANEPGIAGATVMAIWVGPDGAFGGGDDVTFTTTTDALGNYLVPGIPANALVGAAPNYRVTVADPASFPVFTDSLDNGALAAVRPIDIQVSPTDGSALNDRRDVDFGFRGTASLGDTVFLDSNGNGRQDGGAEVGIPGVGVSLFFDRNADGDFADIGEDVALATTTTGAGGLYAFTDLAAGNYQVVFGTTAAGVTYTRTVADSAVATDATDSDADQLTGRTGTYTLANGVNNVSVDAGLYVPVSLGDRVYYDLNGDGVQQGGELGIPGVGVQVVWHGPDGALGGGDDQTFNTTTVADGIWTVGNLPPGSFTVTATPPTGAGFDQLTDSLDNGVLSATNPVVVSTTSGVNRTDIDFGYRGLGTIGDRVFLDANANGTFDAGEGLDGVVVTLTGDLNGDGTPDTLTTTTAADGAYQFPFLRVTAAGVPYTVTISPATLPQTGAGTPVTNTVDPDTANPGDNTSSLTLTAGAPSNQLQDFGYRGPGRIGDTVYLDANANNAPDAGEGITGVLVRLRADVDGDGTTEDFFATTNAAGVYDFSGLPVRTPAGALIAYTVTVDPAGTTLPAGVTNTVDPDGGGDGSAVLTLDPANPVNLAQDFGYRGPGSVGDRVFLDVNANGSFDPGEGLTAVTVTLAADLNGDGVTETLTTTTDADGFYQFTGLPVFQNSGTAVPYVVTVLANTLPAGLTNTVDPDTASPGDNRSSLTLSAAAPSNQAQDFGYRGTGSLGDRVWIDSNGDGLQGTVALEPGLPGVSLTLTWSGADDTFGTADDVTGTTTTNAAGAYTFNGLPLDLGRFRVAVTPATLPGNATPTFDLDGLATPNDAGTGAPVTLATGTPTRTDVDFGYVGSGSLGDRVYVDQNRDGVQQASEGGIPGATVTLTWVGPDGDINTGADNVTFTTTTGANGLYLFPGLMVNGLADDYRVLVTLPVSGFTLTDSLDDAFLRAQNPTDVDVYAAVGDPRTNRRDVDFGFAGSGSLAGTVFRDDNDDGTQLGEPGIAGVVVTLTGTDVFGNPVLDPATGQPFTTLTDASGNYSFTGLPPGTYTITETQPTAYGDGQDRAGSLLGTAGNDVISGIVVGPNQAGVGYTFGELPTFVSGTVFRDDNRDGTPQVGEPGIGGVRVELRDPVTGNLIAFTTTDATGGYVFDRIPAGNYRIVEIQPTGYADGPVGPATVRDVTVPTTGLTGQNFAEVLGSLTGRVYIDTDNDGTRDAGEPGIPGVTVTVSGTDVNGNPVNVNVTTDADGRYTVLNLFPADAAGYTIAEGPTPLYADRAANVGTGFATPGTAATPNRVTGVNLTPGQAGVDYDFGEITGSLSGFVYADFDMNGVRTLTGARAETGTHVPGTNTPGGIAGITITLTGTDTAGTAVNRTTTTAADGSYVFTGLAAGNYTLTQTQPPAPTSLTNGFYDGAESQGSVGGTVVVPSPTFTADPNKNRITLISLPAGADGTNYNFGELPPADPFGFVYVDANRNGVRDAGERGIPNVPVSLSGTAFAGTAFARPLTAADVPGGLTQLTDANGRYEFVPIPAGLYTLTEDRQPAGFADGQEQDGDPNGPPATVGNEVISNIALAPFPIRGPFNFGEVALPVAPGTLPPIDFFPATPEDPSKRLFLSNTPEAATPPAAATAPNFAAFNPGPRPAALVAVAEGPGGTGLVRVFDFAGGAERFRFRPFGDYAGGARVTTADVTADGIPDIIVVPGVGGGPLVKVFDGNSGAEVRSFLAFEESFRGGLRVAAADLNGDFVADLIVTPDTGGGPIVRAFDGRTGATIANFFALDPTFRGGLRVATGDVNRDGTSDVVVTAGEGGGPRVAVYDGRTLGAADPARLANDFFGFAPELRNGFWLSSADVDGDGFADVVMGAGAGGAPRVVVYSGRLLAAGDGPREVASFFAGEPTDRGGARVLAADLDGDGRAEVASGAGAGTWPLVGVYDPLTGVRRDVFYATSAPFRGGVEVG